MSKDITIQDSVDRLAVIAKKLAETKESKKYDFSSTPLALTIGTSEGTTFANIAKPANFDKVPVGSEAKILVKLPTNPAELPPTDDVQVAMIGTYLWIDKAATNIMNWGEVKNQLQAGKIMVITRLADVDVQGNTYQTFQLARWEDAPATPNVSGYWQTIDHLTYTFTKPIKIRMTHTVGVSIGYISIGNNKAFFQALALKSVSSIKKNIVDIIWESKNPKMGALQTEYIFATKTSEVKYYEDAYDVIKVEIWVE